MEQVINDRLLPVTTDMEYPNISVRRNILSDKVQYKTFQKSVLLSRMVADQFPQALHNDVVVVVDQDVVPRDQWDRVVVTPSQYIFMGLAPAGGDSGKSIIAAVAMIAVAIFAPYAAAAIMGGGMTAGTLSVGGMFLAAGIAMVGSLLIGMLFKPPVPDTHTEDSTFALTGVTNRARPGAGFRRVFGRRKIAPDIAALPFTITQGNDQYLYSLFDCGYGPLKVSDIRIGNQSITNFDNIDMNVIYDATDGSQLQIYRNDHFTVKLGTQLLQAAGPEIIKTSGPANGAVLDIGFPEGLIRNKSDGDKRSRVVELNIEYRKSGSGGTWLPYADLKTTGVGTGGTTQIDLLIRSQNTITDAELTENPYEDSENVHVYRILEGTTVFTAETPHDTLDIGVGMLFYVGAQVLYVNAATKLGEKLWQLTSATALKTDIEVGRVVNPVAPSVDTVTIGASLKRMEFMRNTPSPMSLSISRKKARPFTVSFQFEFPNDDNEFPVEWELRVTRLSGDIPDDNQKIQDNTQLNSLRTIRYRSPIAWEDPHTIIELKIKATDQLAGQLDNLTCIVQSKVATYLGDGTVENPESLTRNPAWHALHALMSNENPRPVLPERIDFLQWRRFAAFCNSPDPVKGEARHRCDVEILGTGTVQRVVETILGTGRGTMSLADGLFSVLWDVQPTVPIQLISTHNSNSMSAARNFIDIPNAIRAHFVDPQTDWEQAELIVYNDGFAAEDDPGNGLVKAETYEDMTLVGITRSNQTFRDVRYHMAQGILRQETLTINMDWENLVATRGDLVQVQEDSIFLGGLPGRVTNISGMNIRSSEPFSIGAEQYSVRLRESTGEIKLVDITGQVDEFTVTLASMPGNLKIGDLLVWGVKNLETFPYIIKAVRPRPNLEAELVLMQLAPGVYTADTKPIPPYSPGISPDLESAPIITPTVGAELVSRNGPPAFTIVVEWEPIPRLIRYNIWLWSDAEPEWKIHGVALEGQDRYILFEDFRLDPDNYNYRNIYRIKVTGVNIYGRESSFPDSPWVEFDPRTDTDIGGAPPTLAFFDIDVRGEEVLLEWEVDEGFENIGGFIIKYTRSTSSPNPGMWKYSQMLARNVAWDARSATFPARVGTYMIKTFNIFGKPADDANYAKTTIPSLPNLKFYETVDDAPQWAGGKTNVVVNKSALYLAKDSEGYVENGNYAYASFIDLGDIYTIRAFSYFRWFGVGASTLMSTWTPSLASLTEMAEEAPDGLTDAIQEVNIYDPEKTEWTGWRTFIAGDYTGRYFAFRLQMASGDPEYTPVVGSGEIELEIPYRYEQAYDMRCPPAGIRVEYPRPFFSPPALAISAASEINEWHRITNKSETGFNIRFYTKASGFGNFGATAIEGFFDYQARGYGAKEWALPTKGQSNSNTQVLRPKALGLGGDRIISISKRRSPNVN
jgi:hypothetical protein